MCENSLINLAKNIKKKTDPKDQSLKINLFENYFLIALMVCLEPSFIFRITKYIPEFNPPK
jgi:hypothetical protein